MGNNVFEKEENSMKHEKSKRKVYLRESDAVQAHYMINLPPKFDSGGRGQQIGSSALGFIALSIGFFTVDFGRSSERAGVATRESTEAGIIIRH